MFLPFLLQFRPFYVCLTLASISLNEGVISRFLNATCPEGLLDDNNYHQGSALVFQMAVNNNYSDYKINLVNH